MKKETMIFQQLREWQGAFNIFWDIVTDLCTEHVYWKVLTLSGRLRSQKTTTTKDSIAVVGSSFWITACIHIYDADSWIYLSIYLSIFR